MLTAPRTVALRAARRSAVAAACLLGGASLAACAARQDRRDQIVNQMTIHGTSQVPEGDVRAHIATQPTTWLNPFLLHFSTQYEYYDPTTFRRDLARVERYYEARGYYSAAVEEARVSPRAGSREVDIAVTVREGAPTRVGSVWISGCEPESLRDGERFPVPPRACQEIRAQMQLHLGEVFTEAALAADEQLLADLMREQGHATARVGVSATVDPLARRADVVFVLMPGPRARFGRTEFYGSGSGERAIAGNTLENGFPLGPVRSAVSIDPGQPYSRTALADAQRRVFELGAFGVARIVESPHVCDAHDRCDEDADPNDRLSYARVDLRVYLSPVARDRIRFGVGGEVDQIRSNVHAVVNYENHNFLGGLRRLTLEPRIAVFLPFSFGGALQTLAFGGALAATLRQPEIFRRTTGIATLTGELGPDPINPIAASRARLSPAVGAQAQIDRGVTLGGFLRATALAYNTNGSALIPSFFNPNGASTALLSLDPIYNALYQSQIYVYLDQQFNVDRRDNPLQTRRGWFFGAGAQEGVSFLSGPFLRGTIEGRGYIQLEHHVVLAFRGLAGAVFGFGNSMGASGSWPIPPDMRFFSGGANSNRGYPFNRVGYTGTIPQRDCNVGGTVTPAVNCYVPGAGPDFPVTTAANRASYQPGIPDDGGARPDPRRVTAIGGTTVWEASVELRWYLGNLGLVAFADASDIGGFTPPTQVPMAPNPIRGQTLPAPPQPAFALGFDPHPSAGIGVRYNTPVGVVRLDLGLRLDDLGCGAYLSERNKQNRDTGNSPAYYLFSRPQCDLFGLPFPGAVQFAIGEAY